MLEVLVLSTADGKVLSSSCKMQGLGSESSSEKKTELYIINIKPELGKELIGNNNPIHISQKKANQEGKG